MEDYAAIVDEMHRYDAVRCELKFGRRSEGPLDLTVVIPTYKRTDGLERALASIFDQKTDFRCEVILCDNENFDLAGTEKEIILNKFRDKPLAYYQNERNIGLFGNWNRCIRLAATKWVAMLHDDDWLSNDYFDKLSAFWHYLQNHDVAYVKALSDVEKSRFLRKKQGIIHWRDVDLEVCGPCYMGRMSKPTCGTLFNRDLIMASGGFNERFYPNEDAYFLVRMMKELKYQVFRTTECMGFSEMDGSTTVRSETLLHYGKNFMDYLPYYRQWGIASRFLCAFFTNELIYVDRDSLMRFSGFAVGSAEMAAFRDQVDKVLPRAERRPVHLFLYRKLQRLQQISERFRKVWHD